MTVYGNPITFQRANPWVFKVDGGYWFTTSDPEYDKIAICHASTVNNLQRVPETVVWHRYESGVYSKYIWAPELHRVNSMWYIYFVSAEHESKPSGIPTHRMPVLENTDTGSITDNWVEKGQIVMPMDSFSLDATTEMIDDVQYPVWAQKDHDVPSNSSLYIALMTNPRTLATDPVMLTKSKYDWECIDLLVNEGPAFLFHDDRTLITYSVSSTGVPYAVSLLTADRGNGLVDPKSWIRGPVPVFKICSESDQYGPGHNSSTKPEDGFEDLMICHTRNYTEIKDDPLFDPNRHARVGVMCRNEDGIPGSGVPESDNLWTPVTTDVLPPGDGPETGTPAVGLTVEV